MLPLNVTSVAMISNFVIGYLVISLDTISMLPHRLEKNSACDINVICALHISNTIHMQYDIDEVSSSLMVSTSFSLLARSITDVCLNMTIIAMIMKKNMKQHWLIQAILIRGLSTLRIYEKGPRVPPNSGARIKHTIPMYFMDSLTGRLGLWKDLLMKETLLGLQSAR